MIIPLTLTLISSCTKEENMSQSIEEGRKEEGRKEEESQKESKKSPKQKRIQNIEAPQPVKTTQGRHEPRSKIWEPDAQVLTLQESEEGCIWTQYDLEKI